MKAVCVSYVIFQTLLAYTSGQMRPPNWDQRFGQRPDFFEQNSGNSGGNGRRNFYGNNFRPGEMFPQINPPGDNNGRRPVELPPSAGQPEQNGGVPQQIPTQTGPNPDQFGPVGGVGPETSEQDQVFPQLPPPMGQTPGQIGPAGGMGPGSGQNEGPPPQPPPEQNPMGPGMQDPLGVGQEEVTLPQQPPINRRPMGVPTPAIPELPVDRDRGIGEPPNPGETELMNPQLPPMARNPNSVGQGGELERRGLQPPGNEVSLINRRPSQPPLIPETPLSPNQPGGLPGMDPGGMEGSPLPSMPQNPDGLVPDQDMAQPGQFGGQDMLRDPGGQGGELRRQRRPMGQVRGSGPNSSGFGGQPGRQSNVYNRPPKYQTSK